MKEELIKCLAKIDMLAELRNDLYPSIQDDPQSVYDEGYADGRWRDIAEIDAYIAGLKTEETGLRRGVEQSLQPDNDVNENRFVNMN